MAKNVVKNAVYTVVDCIVATNIIVYCFFFTLNKLSLFDF